MLNDLLEELGIETDLDYEKFEKSSELADALQIVTNYFEDCPDDFKSAIRSIITLGLNEKEGD